MELGRIAWPWLLLWGCVFLAESAVAAPLVAGWVERVRILEAAIEVRAKLDTGARHSSLNATNLHEFQRGGEDWVRFCLRNYKNRVVTIERPVVRMARIKSHFSESHIRPVIELTLCVGGLARKVEVNLTDRENFNYQLLVGRSFLRHGILVDSAVIYRQSPACEGIDIE
jgi:hypothetical protein